MRAVMADSIKLKMQYCLGEKFKLVYLSLFECLGSRTSYDILNNLQSISDTFFEHMAISSPTDGGDRLSLPFII